MKLNKKHVALIALSLASGTAMAGGVSSATADSFNDILAEVQGWLVGAPGKIIAVLAFGAAMFNVVKQNFIAAVGAFLGALMMAFAGTVIDGIFSAGI